MQVLHSCNDSTNLVPGCDICRPERSSGLLSTRESVFQTHVPFDQVVVASLRAFVATTYSIFISMVTLWAIASMVSVLVELK